MKLVDEQSNTIHNSEFTLANCLNKLMRAPLPNELVRLEWKASVGYSEDKTATHLVCKKDNNKKRKNNRTYSDPGRYKITLVQQKHKMLMCFILLHVLFNVL